MRYLINLIIATLTYLLLAIPCPAAPAPFPKTARYTYNDWPCGTWTTQDGRGILNFYPDGHYTANWYNTWWDGRWTVVEKNIVYIEERQSHYDPSNANAVTCRYKLHRNGSTATWSIGLTKFRKR